MKRIIFLLFVCFSLVGCVSLRDSVRVEFKQNFLPSSHKVIITNIGQEEALVDIQSDNWKRNIISAGCVATCPIRIWKSYYSSPTPVTVIIRWGSRKAWTKTFPFYYEQKKHVSIMINDGDVSCSE